MLLNLTILKFHILRMSLLFSLLVMFDAVPGHSFSMVDFAVGTKTLPVHTQVFIFLGFLVGFGVKMPIPPPHTHMAGCRWCMSKRQAR